MSDLIGRTLGHYRITAKLGEGGMGEVYRAHDERLDRTVAIKVLPEEVAGDPHRLARFEREAILLASLNHPNIATLHGLEEENGRRFLVMELVEGEDLAGVLVRGAIPVDEALAISLQIAKALEMAHEHSIVHRDLKPANVMVNAEGVVKILDFGIAKAFDPEASSASSPESVVKSPTLTSDMTRAGQLLGTAAYMSPEQARGKAVDKRVDIWAFGCVLYEMLTGTRAFAGTTSTETLAAIVKDEPDWDGLPAETPTPVRRLLRRCLTKDPRDRLHDIADARIELQSLSRGPGLMVEDDLLQSWKEIAAHLGRSERTCRRWENEFGLPIHRMDGSVRSSVFAYKKELDRWMDEILHEKEEPPSITSRLRSAKYLTVILALAAIFVVAVAAVLLRTGRPEPKNPPSSENPTLAILPFTNNTGDESLDFWENALADLLVSDLSQSRYLSVLPQDRVFFVLRDLDLLDAGAGDAIDLTEVAARTKVENIVVGNFIRAGQRFRISATVRHIPTGDSVVLPSVEAISEEEIFLKIDALSTKIKNHLVRPVGVRRRDPDLEVGTITTSSLEAYRYFVDGRASWYNGRVRDALESFERAVAIDPEFAMAYYWLAGCYFSLPGHGDKNEESLSRAFALSHHASPRERFHIRGQYYRVRSQRNWDQAIETFLEFVKVYPDDDLAVYRLGRTYGQIEEWERCIEILESIIDVRMFSSHIVDMRQAHSALGQYEAALEVARGIAPGVDSLQYRHQLALNLIYERRFEAALLEADTMLERTPGYVYALMVKGDVHFYRAEWDRAEEYYRELLNPVAKEHNRLWLRIDALRRLANLYVAKGQYEKALDFVS